VPNTTIVEVQNLRKEYKKLLSSNRIAAVDGLDLTIGQPGIVHGFLGPNGSGKTTTIRCLLGLVRPTTGNVRLFGADVQTSFHEVAPRVGALVENPKMFPKFSGRKNLDLLAQIGGLPATSVDRALTIVGLAGRQDDKFETYSLGMKQRLAIASALLKDPDLLILDEPANGLDPAGIAEMRVLIRGIADQGKAVLVSSHQLAEIEQVCDEVTIIDRGRLVQTGSTGAVRDSAGGAQVIVTIDDRYGAAEVLAAAGLQVHWGDQADEMIVEIDPSLTGEVTRVLAQSGRFVLGLRVERITLESAFLTLTGPTAGELT